MLDSQYQTAGYKTGLTVDDFDFLIKAFPSLETELPPELPSELGQKLLIYKIQVNKLKGLNRKEKVEEKVRQMCYDMLVNVLEIQGKDHDKIQQELVGTNRSNNNYRVAYAHDSDGNQNVDPHARYIRKSQGQGQN